MGGRFAINGGGLDAEPGEVCYWAPDTLDWTGIGGGHSRFVGWALGGGLTDFYESLRWDGWEGEVAALAPDQGLSVYPPPFAREGRAIRAGSRKPVPIAELHGFYAEIATQLRELPHGSSFRMRTTEYAAHRARLPVGDLAGKCVLGILIIGVAQRFSPEEPPLGGQGGSWSGGRPRRGRRRWTLRRGRSRRERCAGLARRLG
jgi:hypothetical protein